MLNVPEPWLFQFIITHSKFNISLGGNVIVDGTLAIHDQDTNPSWKAAALGMSVLVFNDVSNTLQINLHGTLHDGTEAGMWDTKTDAFFPVLTDLSAATASDPKPVPSDHSPHAMPA